MPRRCATHRASALLQFPAVPRLIDKRGTIAVADIFISYSKPDRDKVAMLAAYLESEGWTVWWDRNLTAGEPYRDEIMRELVAARAVIALWTPSSIKSDFVRAEAGRAKADGKLIPVKTDDVGYGDIPLPFGEMHTERLVRQALIRAAVVAQLAKPIAHPSGLWLATKLIRYQAITWFGIIGGTITLFANLRGILHLTAWANWLVSHWREWSHALLHWLLSLVQIRVPPPWVPVLTFAIFAILIAFGQWLLYTAARTGAGHHDAVLPDEPAINWKKMVMVVAFQALLIITMGVVSGLFSLRSTAMVATFVLMNIFGPGALLVLLSKHRVKCFISVAITIVFCVVMVVPDNRATEGSNAAIGNFLAFGLVPAVMLTIAPINALTKRLCFLATGVVILIGLNELSKYAHAIRTFLMLQ